MPVEQPDQQTFGLVAGFRVVSGLARALVGNGDKREGVGFGFKVVDLGSEFVELGYREVQVMSAAEGFIAVVVRFPAVFVIGQDGQAGDGGGVAVIEPVVVGEHALREVGVAAALDFDMDLYPACLTIVEDDLNQCVCVAFAEFGIAHDLAQFGVLEFVAAGPVDLAMGGGEVVGHEFGKRMFEHLFPRAVVFVVGRVWFAWAVAIYCYFAALGAWLLDCRVGFRLLAMTGGLVVIASDSAAIQCVGCAVAVTDSI